MDVQEQLGLSNDEWDRGGKHILNALDIARGWNAGPAAELTRQ
jgi:hypothetical protein